MSAELGTDSASATRAQHIVPGALVLLLASTVTWLSYTGEPVDAFLFPRLISIVMLVLAAWNFGRCVLGLSKVGSGVSLTTIKRIWPGLLVSLVFVFYAAKALGFYTASFVAFLTLFSLYDPASHTQLSSWFKRIVVTVGFMAVIYVLFTVLLRVQTPRGMFL